MSAVWRSTAIRPDICQILNNPHKVGTPNQLRSCTRTSSDHLRVTSMHAPAHLRPRKLWPHVDVVGRGKRKGARNILIASTPPLNVQRAGIYDVGSAGQQIHF